MDDYELIERSPDAQEYNDLRVSVGWPASDSSDVAVALRNSLFAACVIHCGKTVGMVRVIGDGRIVFYIQDLVVAPEHQRYGLGSLLMSKCMDYIRSTDGKSAWVGLMANSGLGEFYGKFGFKERPLAKPGMEAYITKKNANQSSEPT